MNYSDLPRVEGVLYSNPALAHDERVWFRGTVFEATWVRLNSDGSVKSEELVAPGDILPIEGWEEAAPPLASSPTFPDDYVFPAPTPWDGKP